MATGSIKRFAQRSSGGKVTGSRVIKDENGNFVTITEEIFEAGRSTPDSKRSYVVDISDQLSSGKYVYNFVDNNGAAISSSNAYNVFLNGINVTAETTISGDGLSFEFAGYLPANSFSFNQILLISFVES